MQRPGRIYGEESMGALRISQVREVHQEGPVETGDMLENQVRVNMSLVNSVHLGKIKIKSLVG